MSNQSDFNLQTINTKEYAENLKATIEFGGNLFAVAKRGSGKTAIASDIICQSKHKEIYFNLSLFERVDLAGYPDFFNSKKDRFINFLMPGKYRDLMEGEQPCVAVLDEVDKADTSLLSPLLEFVDKHSINGVKLPNLHSVIMMGNLPNEGGSQPPPTLLDRTEKFLVEVNPMHWIEWAGSEGHIHPSVVAYIADNMTDLSGEIDPGENYAGPSGRSWENASKLITFGEQHNWSPQLMLHKVAGCVGKRICTKYAAFFEHYQVLLPTVNAIMQGEKTPEFDGFEETKKLVVAMILCQRFAKMLDELKDKHTGVKTSILSKNLILTKISGRVADFLAHHIDPDVSLISVRGQIGHKRVLEFELANDPNWDLLLDSLVSRVE